MKKLFTQLTAILLLLAMLSGLALAAADPSASPSEAPAGESYAPTEDPVSSDEPAPTESSEPTSSEEPVPSESPDPSPSEEPVPTESPDPAPSEDPVPTESPDPTVSEDPEPTVSPEPSEDPVPPEDPEHVGEKIIRVGLYYGSDAVVGSNIGNSVGKGFYFGYYDSENNFIPVGQTSHETISVVKTTNVYYGTKNDYATYYDDLTNASVAVGCYHLQIPGSRDSFEQASAEAESYENGFVAYIGGAYYVRIGNFLNRDSAVAEQQRYATEGVTTEIKGTSSYGLSVVIKGTDRIIFQYDDNGSGTGLGVEPIPTEDGQKCLSYFRNITWHGGFRYERIDGGNITIVNMIQLDDYIKGVVCREMSYTWPTEALKAQAVASRCYALTQLNRHKKYHFDLCHGQHCHAYWGREKAAAQSDAAVDETAGIVAMYNGKVIEAYYYSSNGGASESSSVVWGSKQSSYPYLLGVVDPFEETVENIIPSYRWTRTYTASELTKMMNGEGYPNSTIVSVEVVAYSDSGNPASVKFTDKAGKEFTLTAKAMQEVFDDLRSYRYDFVNPNEFEVNINGEIPVESTAGLYVIDGNGNVVPVEGNAYVITDSGISPADGSGVITGETFVIQGAGWGHNVGMSQYGAYAMAKLGYTYEEILQFYYTGITVGELIENN